MESADIMARLRAGEVAAFDALFARSNGRLFRFLVRLSGRPALAEELLQETWLRFSTLARTLPEGTEPNAWLFTVARNLYRSQRRRELLHTAGLSRCLRWLRGPEPDASPFELHVARDTTRRLERALDRLPLAQREVLLLCTVERMEPAEAGAVLGIRAEAARQRLARARASLLREFERAEWPAGTRDPAGENP